MYGPDGLNGDIETLLYPIQHGMLRFVGFDVLAPFIAWEPARVSPEQRRRSLVAYEARLAGLQTEQPVPYPHRDEYDAETFRRKPVHGPSASRPGYRSGG